MPCVAWLGPWEAASCLSRSRPAVEPTGDDRAGGPDIRLPSAGLSWSVLTTSNPSVPTRSFLSGSARSSRHKSGGFLRPASRSFSIQLRPSYIPGHIPASIQAPIQSRRKATGVRWGIRRSGLRSRESHYGEWVWAIPLSHANPMGAFSRGRARSSVLGIGSQVPGTRDGGGESGNKAECPSHASKARTRGMLCQA
jgi:hypothetical protein